MKFGIGLSVQHLPEDSQAARFQEHVEQVRLARAVGFTSVWASQHYLSDPFTYFQPIPTLARVAAAAAPTRLARGERRRRRPARGAPRGRLADEPPRHAPDARAPAGALPEHAAGARPPRGDRDATDQGVLRRAGVVHGARGSRGV